MFAASAARYAPPHYKAFLRGGHRSFKPLSEPAQPNNALANGTRERPMSDLLKQLASAKRNPEFGETVREITDARHYAEKMRKAGKLTKAEFEDFEASQYNRYIEALPPDEFHEMMKDGRLGQLQAMAGHDGTRDGYGVEKARRAVNNKIKADALDEAWLSQKIDAKRYANEMRDISAKDHDLDNRLADEDYDGVAAERFASRHDAPKDHTSDFEKIFAEYLPKGDRSTGSPAARGPVSKPVAAAAPAKEDPWEGIVDYDAED
jgi:hypothetical protein